MNDEFYSLEMLLSNPIRNNGIMWWPANDVCHKILAAIATENNQ